MRQKKTSSKAASGTAAVNRRRLLNNESPFAIKEAYVKLRTSLMFCMTADKERTCKTFAITSSKPSEGKSLTAANVAISYAMLGKKVLLIDADMRKPTQRRLWKVELTVGLCDFLAKIWKLEIVKVQDLPLWIVCTGTIPPNPSELLASDRMKVFVRECADRCGLCGRCRACGQVWLYIGGRVDGCDRRGASGGRQSVRCRAE